MNNKHLTPEEEKRRQIDFFTDREKSIVRVATTLLLTLENNVYLDNKQLLCRISECYNDLRENAIGQYETLDYAFSKYVEARHKQFEAWHSKRDS